MRALSVFVIALVVSFTVPAFAVETVLDAPAGTDASAAMHNAAGIKAYNSGDYGSAEKHFKEAAAASHNLAEAHFNLAIALHSQGRHIEATEHFRHALKFGASNPLIKHSKLLQHHINK